MLANNFLAGSLISLLIPGLVLIAVVAWFAYSVRRLSGERGDPAAEAPRPSQPGSSELAPQGESPGTNS